LPEEGYWYSLPKPSSKPYHLPRFIRSDLCLNVFRELFPPPSDLQYEYIVGTIDVKEQRESKLNKQFP
jgi:hypothetical protein